MSPEEEGLTAAAKTAAVLEAAAKTIVEAADKAKKNGLTTREEAKADRHSVNLTTIVVGASTVGGAAVIISAGVWFLVTLMLSPMQKQSDRIETLQTKQGEAMVAIQLDLRALYVASDTKKAPRLEQPPVDPAPK